MALLEMKNVDISYEGQVIVKDFSLTIEEGEICSIVGESGSGKTTVIRSIMGLLSGQGQVTAGDIFYDGQNLLRFDRAHWKALRGHDISMIFQDSGAMMNQTKRVGKAFVEYIRTHENISKQEAWDKGKEMLERMRLPDPERVMRSYPFQLSGGMRQRVGIAMGMTYKPKLLLADEPTSALDVTTQAQIVRQMMELRDEYGTSIIIVTHNLGVAAYMGDKIVVMKDGIVEEMGDRDAILHKSENPYTRMLLDAVPSIGGERFV
ncbi:MAG: ABC transporter ATP-binding protein [Lachnospiraceae bacterium]|nr:ABC transporter ATP-binding protein [Lachnospiraceae bacterium]